MCVVIAIKLAEVLNLIWLIPKAVVSSDFFYIELVYFLLASYIFQPASLSSLHSSNLQFEKRSGIL
jgi:hypothetical protein